jgi:hypothetical protein
MRRVVCKESPDANITRTENAMPASTSAHRVAAKTTKPAKPRAGSNATGKTQADKAPSKRGQATMDAAIAATPKGADNAVNANRIASALTARRGKTVWPIPVKRALDRAVALGRVTKAEDVRPFGSVPLSPVGAAYRARRQSRIVAGLRRIAKSQPASRTA